jgi:putative transcriptional regulator
MKRNIGQEILDGIQAIKSGNGRSGKLELPPAPKRVRDNMGLSQTAFAGLLGVSVRTLQEWERGEA